MITLLGILGGGIMGGLAAMTDLRPWVAVPLAAIACVAMFFCGYISQ